METVPVVLRAMEFQAPKKTKGRDSQRKTLPNIYPHFWGFQLFSPTSREFRKGGNEIQGFVAEGTEMGGTSGISRSPENREIRGFPSSSRAQTQWETGI